MKQFHSKSINQPDMYVELNDGELSNVRGGQGVRPGYDEESLRDRCYYDKKRHRRYCYDRHGHRYEPHDHYEHRHHW